MGFIVSGNLLEEYLTLIEGQLQLLASHKLGYEFEREIFIRCSNNILTVAKMNSQIDTDEYFTRLFYIMKGQTENE